MGAAPIDGIYHGDTRLIRSLALTYAADPDMFALPEWIGATSSSASRIRFDAVLRDVDDAWPDPKVRLERVREVAAGRLAETITVRSHLSEVIDVRLRLTLVPDFSPLQDVKAGATRMVDWTAADGQGGIVVSAGDAAFTVAGPHARTIMAEGIHLDWLLEVPPSGAATATWSARFEDVSLVVQGVGTTVPWQRPAPTSASDPRLDRWLGRALDDLAALRLTLPGSPRDVFFAAGAPWFLTLFGRDSLWSARLLLPLDASIAASTLRVLASLQGTTTRAETAEQPGKIMHELRSGPLAIPSEGVVLPPLYYGTVDATPLWVCLLAETAPRLADDAVAPLLPALRAAVEWIVLSAGDEGFLDYVDVTGHGLSNQGWKDSGDSIQWRDGALAVGPIALCEVQGYAYEAAIGGAALLERFGQPGADRLRQWAAGLKQRFAERFWVNTHEGRYPAIALDRDGGAVDTLTSNIGHLLGTGILDADEESSVAALLTGPAMSSGFGVRTLSTGAAGYWPLSYHGGSVWPHDTAIVARGMARAGLRTQARRVATEMLAAAESFAYRVPELFAGDAADEVAAPAPYPASCRPQAWSAAAAVTAWDILRGS